MSQENVELVRRINELFNRGDFERMYALADPPPEFEYVPNVEAGPDILGVQRGREGFRRVVEVFWDEFDDPHIELHESPALSRALLPCMGWGSQPVATAFASMRQRARPTRTDWPSPCCRTAGTPFRGWQGREMPSHAAPGT